MGAVVLRRYKLGMCKTKDVLEKDWPVTKIFTLHNVCDSGIIKVLRFSGKLLMWISNHFSLGTSFPKRVE